jgi:hypothetical protein
MMKVSNVLRGMRVACGAKMPIPFVGTFVQIVWVRVTCGAKLPFLFVSTSVQIVWAKRLWNRMPRLQSAASIQSVLV